MAKNLPNFPWKAAFSVFFAMAGQASRNGWHQFLSVDVKPNSMNILLIIGCFISAYGVFALIAFRIVKLMFPDTNEHHPQKRWRIKSPEA